MPLRSVLLLAFLCLTFIGYSQTIEGGYYAHKHSDRYREGYYFWKDSTFIWFKQTKTERELGRGKYFLRGDSLFLNFRKAQIRFTLKDEDWLNDDKSTSIEIRSSRTDGSPFGGLQFKIMPSGIGGVVDSTGVYKSEFQIEKKNQNIHFYMPDCRTIDTKFIKGRHHVYTVTFQDKINYIENILLKKKAVVKKRYVTIDGLKLKRRIKYFFLGKFHRV